MKWAKHSTKDRGKQITNSFLSDTLSLFISEIHYIKILFLYYLLIIGGVRVKSTGQKMKFLFKSFFSKCDQIRKKLWIWSNLLNKFLMENFNFFAVKVSPCSFPMQKLFSFIEKIRHLVIFNFHKTKFVTFHYKKMLCS